DYLPKAVRIGPQWRWRLAHDAGLAAHPIARGAARAIVVAALRAPIFSSGTARFGGAVGRTGSGGHRRRRPRPDVRAHRTSLILQQPRPDNDYLWGGADPQLDTLPLDRQDMNGDDAIQDDGLTGLPAQHQHSFPLLTGVAALYLHSRPLAPVGDPSQGPTRRRSATTALCAPSPAAGESNRQGDFVIHAPVHVPRLSP